MSDKQKDNSTFSLKAQLRSRALREVENPVVLETHGGAGKLYARCYASVPNGVVFEKNPMKADQLGKQRPEWAVYEADCAQALRAGVGSHLPVNFADFDPYGGPWLVMDAFFQGLKPVVSRLVFVVHDGLRQRLKMNLAWKTEGLEEVVARRGNVGMYENYVDVCRDLVKEKAARAGYALRRWTGFYGRDLIHREKRTAGTMAGDDSTHYAAVLERAI